MMHVYCLLVFTLLALDTHTTEKADNAGVMNKNSREISETLWYTVYNIT